MKTQLQTKPFNKKLAHLAVAAAITSSFVSVSANANESATADEAIESIVVTANRTPQEQFLALSSTHVITSEEIKALQPQNIGELLERVAGVSVATLGGPGQNTSVYLRGTNSNHTLVLVDGVRVSSATLGSTNFSSMSVGQVQRVEIVKGPRAALWGSDAIGGVIQIFTKKLDNGEGNVAAGFGSFGFWKTEGSVGFGNEKHNLTLAGSLEKSKGFNVSEFDGQEDKDGYNRRAISAVGNSQFTEEISGQLVGRYEKGGAEYDTKWAGSADENEYENYSAKLGSQYKTDVVFAEVSVATMKDQGGTFVSGDKENTLSEITTKRNQFGLLGQYMLSDETSATAGFDWYKEKVSAGDLDSWTPGNQSWSKDSRTTKAFYVLGRHQMNSFLFEGAVRRDDIQGLDAETTYNLSAGYQLNSDWLVSASRGTGFKAPTFNDLYWPGSGNPLLKPEKVESNEILVRGQLENADIEVSFYDSQIEDLIAWAPDASGAWKPMNINKADIQGLEFTGNYYIGDWSHNLAATYVKTEDKGTGKELLRRPKVSANYTLGYQVGALTANATLRYRGESMDAGDVKLASSVLTDLSLSYEATNSLTIIGKVNNLFDKDYKMAEGYKTAGINYQVTASYSF